MLLNVKQVSERLAVSTAIVYRLIETGKLAAHRIGLGRGTIRVTEEQLVQFLNENMVQRAPMQKRKKKLKHIEF